MSAVDAFQHDHRAVVVPPRCAVDECRRFLVDSDGGTICHGCIVKHCSCAGGPMQIGPYRIHAAECRLRFGLVSAWEAGS